MSMDFTVIQPVRQRFGSLGTEGERAVFSDAPLVGRSKRYSFDCPGINPAQVAVLQFATIGIDVDYTGTPGDGLGDEHVLQINGVNVPGGLQPGELSRRSWSTYFPTWKTQILLVTPHTLRSNGNDLYIEVAVRRWGDKTYVIDSFVIDNIVIFYKTFPRLEPAGASAA